jgi:hypothetical protein
MQVLEYSFAVTFGYVDALTLPGGPDSLNQKSVVCRSVWYIEQDGANEMVLFIMLYIKYKYDDVALAAPRASLQFLIPT